MTGHTLATLAEESGYKRTGKIDEVERLSAEFQRVWPRCVRSFEYGRSAEGRPLRALVISETGALSAEAIKAHNVPLLMLQAGIHPGESDGKDAGFMALRDILKGSVAPGVLTRIAILFVPAFNTDGHERTGRWNRPNQNGPEETGWRTTAQNLNLNRDYTKADAPEMRAMLRLIDTWDPLVCADLHVTDGADFQPDISLQVEPINQGDPILHSCALQLRERLIGRLADSGALPLDFYPDFARTDDPASGFALTVYSPRFSTGYFAQRNRFTVLVETHSWKEYSRRVRLTYDTIVTLAELLYKHGCNWSITCSKADASAVHLGGREVVLDYTTSWREPAKAGAETPARDVSDARTIEFRGYAYTRNPSPISGGLVTAYDPTKPQIWRVPMRDTVKPLLTVTAPRGGYLIPVSFVPEIGPRLQSHGVRFEALARRLGPFKAQAFRAHAVQFSSAPFEGRMRASIAGGWSDTAASIEAGSLFVPIAQPLARLVVALLEPRAPDSFAAWGFFNSCFEQKEQMEPYVAEQIAARMLAADPRLRDEFEARLKSDAAFAASPGDRLEFFLRRHSSWDERYNLYPVLRLDTALPTQQGHDTPG
jgi:murein tripeptide amidase MpaA